MKSPSLAGPSSPAQASTGSDVGRYLETNQVFRTLVDSVGDYAIFVLDPQGYVRSWNRGAERMKGYKPEEIIGKHFSVFYPPAEIAKGKPPHELEVAAGVGRFEDEGWRLRKDGTRFWANVIITRIPDEKGGLLGFGKITRDLTDRRQSELRYRLLVEAVSDYAIFSLDTHGNVTSWNAGGQRIKGYSAQEIIGKNFSTFYTPEDRAAGLPAKVLRTASETGHFEGEGWRLRKDGSRFWCSVVVTALRDEEGALTGFSKVTRDITDRKLLMERLQQHSAELESGIAERDRVLEELEAFSYSVSHDLRAPLRAIRGFADILREDYADQLETAGQEYLDQIILAAGRMSRLVQDLLEYGRLGRTDLILEPVNAHALVQNAAEQAGIPQSTVENQVPAGISVMAHPSMLNQILVNLLSNAAKFTAKGRDLRVIVRSKAVGGQLRLEVSDNGIGIAPEHRERIFRVFERLHATDAYPGTGIGLAIVKRGIERMGGTCGVESEEGRGSTFWVQLPLAAEQR